MVHGYALGCKGLTVKVMLFMIKQRDSGCLWRICSGKLSHILAKVIFIIC